MPCIKLQSQEQKVFSVDIDVAKMSETIKVMMEDLDIGQDAVEVENEQPVPLPNVSTAVLEKVIEWSTHHKDDAPFVEIDETKYRRTDDVSEWDKEFFDVSIILHTVKSLNSIKCTVDIVGYRSGCLYIPWL
jgi:S-phase kinase-associated protein 1